MKCHQQCVCLLLQVISFVAICLAENLMLNINFKKPIAITDHAFLSFTLDPTVLLHNNDFIKKIERSTNMARGLAPAYVRLGGPQSNIYNFERDYSHVIDMDPNNMHFGTQWTLIYQWAKNAGLDVIACVTPRYIDNESKTHSTDPRNIAELLSFSDRMGYNISWQLGYECQTRCDLSGEELGRYVTNLREMLKSFPRYSNSLITGPDIVAYRTVQQQRYLQDYLHSADAALSAITWHPDLDSVSLNNDSISMHYDNMIVEKDEIYKIISRVAGKKPLWIAESKPDESKHQYLEALIWMRRLGNAAKLGIQVVMRQLSELSQANPIYWMSLLYKTLVGREVLEMKFQSNNESHVHFYSQCTKPSALYSKGAITIFGINLTSRKVTASLKDLKIKILHKYILSPDFETGNRMFSEKVLLNNKPLNLINDKNLPDINPEIIINPDGLELELSSGDIGFWIIPDAKVKACIWSEEETTEKDIVKKLSKRQENDIRQDNQEEKEEDINQSNVIEEDVKKDTSQSNSKNRKIYAKQDRKKQENVENTKNESQQKVWNSKLLAKIKRILQKRLQKNGSSNIQRSFIVDLGEEQGNSSEETEQQNLDKKHFEKKEVDDKLESIQDTLKKYKSILLEKRTQMDTQDIQDLKPQIQNIDNAVALISKIHDAFLLHKVTSNEPIMGEDKDKAKNKEESIIKMNKKLKEYLIELQNSAETKANIFKKIEKYFNKIYSLVEDNDSTKDNKDSQVSIHKDLMEGKRFKRHLDRKPENSNNIRVLKKRSRIDNLKDYVTKQKIKQKDDDRKKLISSYNTDNSKKNFNNNKNKYNYLSQRDPVKTFFKNNVFENAARDIDYQHLAQEHKRMKNNNIYKKYSKIGDMEKYLSLMQETERTKRDINKKLVEIGLRKDSASRKRSRIDDLKNYVIERKTKQNDDIKREGLLVPFNPRTTDSDENNFYGFFRRDPVKGFPQGDIFLITGDSLEQNGKDYDYVEDDYDDNGSEKKNTQHSQKSMLDHTEDNTWVEEVEDDHCDNIPNEFFENIKFSNTKIKENSKNYDDLWEAEFPFEEHNTNKNNNNNNEFTVTEVIQEQTSNEEKEKRVRETSVQQLVNYYDDSEKQKYDQDAKYKALLASRYFSTSFDQLPKTSTSNINYQVSNVGLKEAKLKMEPEQKISNSFYLSSQVPIARYNYGNYQTSSMNHDEDKLQKENGFVTNIDSRNDINAKTTQYARPTSVYAEYPIHDKTFHNERNKRSNWKELQKVFADEMIKEDEENARDCHCRVIRASDSPKKFFYRRVKRNSSLLTPRSTDISSENKSVNTDNAQSKENVQHSMTKEEYEEIMAGEILPSTSVIEPDYESSIATESVITELNTLDDKPTDTTQMIDVNSISGVDNISGKYNEKKSTTNLLSLDSVPRLSLNNNDSVKYVTKETFFRAQPDFQSENKTETYDSPEIISKIPSQNKDNQEELIVFVANNAQEATSEKIRDLFNEKKKADSSIYPTTTEGQKNEEGYNNNYKTGLKSIDSLKEITFFRAQPDIQSENKTETYDSTEIISKIPSQSKDNREELIVFVTNNAQETTSKKIRDLIDEKNKADSSIYPTSTENQKNEEGYNNDYKTGLKSIDSLKEITFFRAQPDIQSENKTETYDSTEIISKIPSQSKDNREELIVFVTNNAQETTSEKIRDLIDEKKKADSSIYPTSTENQKNEEGYNNDYKTGLKSIDSFKEIAEIAEQVTTETILLKRAASTEVDNSKTNESKRKSKLLQNIEDNQNSESKARTQLGKDANTKKLKTMLQNLPRASLEELIRYEGHLTRRAEHIDKLKEKMYARREKLLHQYQNDLTKIADEHKRNLKRREAWERFREGDDFRRLIDQREFIKVLLDDDVTFEDDDESYLIPIEFVPKQYNNVTDQVYLLAKAKKRYPEHNKYYQFLRNLIEDDEELAETSKSSGRKYKQYYEYIPKIIDDKQEAEGSKFLDREHNQDCQDPSKTIEDERESTETISRFFDRKVFILDPSTYYGGEPILQLHEDYLKLPKYHSNIKSQIQNPTSRWLLGNFHRVLSRLKSSEDQHQASKSQEYIKKLPIKDYYDQGNANIFYVLDTQRQYDLSKKLAALAQVWLTSLNRRDVDQAASNKEADKLNNMHKNLKTDKNNVNSKLAINKKTGFIKDFVTERNIENKEFVSSNNKTEDTLNSETTEDAEVVKIKKSENVELTKHEEVNKSYNSNEKAENNLNINNNKAVEHVKKIIDDDPEAKELGKENMRTRRDVGKHTDEYIERLPYFLLTRTDVRNGLNRDMRVHLEENSKEIFNKQPIALLLLTKKDKPLSADLKSKNHLVSSRKNFKINQENEKGYKSNYIALLPIKVKNIYEMLEAKNNDDSLERFQIPARWNDQYILGKIPDSMNKYLDDEISEEFEYEYEDLSNLQSEDTENIPDEENCSSENKQDVSIEDSEAESENEEQYRITNDKINKYLGIENQIGSNERRTFLLLPWRNIKKRQRRQIKNEANEDIAQVKREVTKHSQPNKSILAEDLENKRTKRYYLNNDIDTEVEENIIETNDIRYKNDIRGNYLQTQTNRKSRDDLLEDFIKAHKKDNNKASFVKNKENNEIIPLNNISKSDKKLLQEVMSKLQDHSKSVEEFVNDSEKNFNDTLASDEDKHHRNRTSGTTGNAFHTAIMNIKDFFTFFPKFLKYLGINFK